MEILVNAKKTHRVHNRADLINNNNDGKQLPWFLCRKTKTKTEQSRLARRTTKKTQIAHQMIAYVNLKTKKNIQKRLETS